MLHRVDKLRTLAARPWLRNAFLVLALGMTALVIAGIVYQNWPEFETFQWHLKPGPLIGAALALVAAFGLNVLTWILISRAFGSHIGIWKDLEIYSFSTIVRRLPGAVWQIVSRTYLYRQEQAALSVPLWGSFWEIVIQLLSGMLLTALMLLLSPPLRSEFPGGLWWLLLLIPAAWSVLRPQDIVSLGRRISPRVRAQPRLTTQSACLWLGLYLISWVLGGVILFFLVSALASQSWTLLPICVGLVAASGVLAILASPIPGGLGIREISLILLLGLYVPSPIAVAGAVLLRLWLLVGEALIAFVVFLVARRKAWQARISHNTP